MKGLMWFREDLRVSDNAALSYAAKQCHEGLIGLYIIDHAMWRAHDVAPCRIHFLLEGVRELQESLRQLNIPLLVVELKKSNDIKEIFSKIIKKYNVGALFFNKQYEVNETKRDLLIKKFFEEKSLACYSYDDQVILSPGRIVNSEGEYYKVFTAYKNAWLKLVSSEGITIFQKPKKCIQLDIVPSEITNVDVESQNRYWVSGEKQASKKLSKFIKEKLFSYNKQRDFPLIEGTSKLSPYLAGGMISVRTCFSAALRENQGELFSGNQGALTWMSELIWRDFYKHLLVALPRLSKHKPYKLETDTLYWKFDEKKFTAWTLGKTGYPIIDAAMRQLNLTGWMHNRLRMIVAMFFTKNLFFDWRLGEKYFMQHLIDGDLSANNGGWQWCASTGTDAAPYFRVFNPIAQSEKFDPDGEFIRRYCPELIGFDKKTIHDPHGRDPRRARAVSYPLPIVDLKKSRAEAVAAFSGLKKIY